MASFTFEHISRETPSFDNDEVYIWVWNADKIPPHLGLSSGKNYFSLTFRGVEDFQTTTMLRKIKRLNVPMIFAKINASIDQQQLFDTFSSYERAKPGGATCLSPIKDVLQATPDVIQLSLLLQFLEKQAQLESVFGLNLPDNYSSLPEYGWQDIVKRIETLDATK